ncbi:MAG: ABC transporter ATP-binding protein [Candidatus Omnitrophota bacterium]
MIKIENLSLGFSGRLDLFVDKLSIEEGGIFTVIGPNGAGKTTLLNIIALFLKPDNGSIEIWGENILKIKDKLNFRRKTSFIFSQPYLFNETVHNNIALPLRLRGRHDTGTIGEMLDLFKIGHLKTNMAGTLSQGEKHRVALARAFVTRPRLVLLDEPFLSLDMRFKESLINDLRKVIRLNKITAIFVTQDQSEALALSDTMAVMMRGKILQQSSPGDIFTRPATREAADFVGVETIIEGRIFKKEDNLCFIRIKDKILEAVSVYNEGDDVFICIRPEDVVISRHTDSSSARNHFNARITNIEPWRLGYKLNLECGFNLAASVTGQSIENLNLKINEEVFVSFKATAIHVIRREPRNDTI